MGAVSLIIIGLMGLVFLASVVVIVVGNIYDRKATRRQQKHHQTYFEQ